MKFGWKYDHKKTAPLGTAQLIEKEIQIKQF